mgnify:CR=1 FL=1
MDNVFDRIRNRSTTSLLNAFQPDEIVEQILTERRVTYGSPNSETLKQMREMGFNPIAITVMVCEETFVFDTVDEANRCAAAFGFDGWYCELTKFLKIREDYVNDFYKGNIAEAPEVYWLI